jgi:hypothetical protein
LVEFLTNCPGFHFHVLRENPSETDARITVNSTKQNEGIAEKAARTNNLELRKSGKGRRGAVISPLVPRSVPEFVISRLVSESP